MNQRDLQQELRGVLDGYHSSGMASDHPILIYAEVLLFLGWMDFYEAEQEGYFS